VQTHAIMTAGLSDRGAGTPVCPLCGAGAHHVLSANGFSILDCSACGHRFSRDAVHAEHLEAVYDDQYFFGGGAGYEDYLVEADLLRAQGARYGRLLARHAPPGRVLDVGCAAGFVQAGLADAGWQTTGLEPNGTMAAHARSTLGLEVHQGGLEEAPDWPPFDAVCLIQVVGHFYDLPRALDAVRALTRPGGLCLVEYWRRDSWIARLLGRRWHEYSPPSVLHWFSRDSLDRALRDREFGHIAHGAPKKYISGGHARSLLDHKLSEMPLGGLVKPTTRLIPSTANIRYPAVDLEWRLYRRAV
jgi:SAM-dependent methyltransferase